MATLDDIRARTPEMQGMSDTTALHYLAGRYGKDANEIARTLGVKLPAPPEPEAPDRGLFGALNDTAIEVANAAVGGLGSAANFVSPGNRFSQGVDEFVRAGEEAQSDQVKQSKARFRQELDTAEGFGQEAAAVGRYILDSPLQAAAQAAGSFVPSGIAVKGTGLLAQGLARSVGVNAARAASAAGAADAAAIAAGMKAGTKVATRAGRLGGLAAGGAMAGGDAAGNAYDLAIKGGATEEQAQAAAREASVVPAIVGGVGGMFGAEKIFAGAVKPGGGLLARTMKGAIPEALQEGVEEGITQYEGQAAAMPYDGSIDPLKGVAGAATMGAALGGLTGGALGALSPNQQLRAAEDAKRDAGMRQLAGATTVDEAIAGAMQATEPGISADLEARALGAIEAQNKADQQMTKAAGRADKTGFAGQRPPPGAGASPLGGPTSASAEFTDAPFADRVLSLREHLNDPRVREQMRQRFGDDALNEADYYASLADRPDVDLPDRTRENMLAVAERMVADVVLQRVPTPEPLDGLGGVSPERIAGPPPAGPAPQLEGPAGRPALPPAGPPTMRVGPDGVARPETGQEQANSLMAEAARRERERDLGRQTPRGAQPPAPAPRPAPPPPAPAPAPEYPARAARTPRQADPVLIDPVASYVRDQRQTNTPAARAFVRDYEAGRITDADVRALLERRPQTPDERIAEAAAQAPNTDGLLLTADGQPYGTRSGAVARARREGGTIIEVPGGWAVRTRDAQQPDVAAPAAVAPRPADGGGADADRGRGAVRPGPDEPAAVDGGDATAPGRRDVAPVAVADGGGSDGALSEPLGGLTEAGRAAGVPEDAIDAMRARRANTRAALPDVPRETPEEPAAAPAPKPAPSRVATRTFPDGGIRYDFKTTEGMDGAVGVWPPGHRQGVNSWEVTLDRVGGPKDEKGQTKFYPTVTIGKYRSEAAARTAAQTAIKEHGGRPEAPAPSLRERAKNLGKKKAKATSKQEQAPAAPAAPEATHKDPGEPAEPVTKAVVTESLQKAARAEDRKPSEMKADLLRMIDEAIASAPEMDRTIGTTPHKTVQGKVEFSGMRGDFKDFENYVSVNVRQGSDNNWSVTASDGSGTGRTVKVAQFQAEGPAAARKRMEQMLNSARKDGGKVVFGEADTVTFKVPGDGVFKVLNTKERLAEFRKRVEASPGFKAQRPGPIASDRVNGYGMMKEAGSRFGVEAGSGPARAAIEGMIDDGDPQAAVDYAAARDLDIKDVLRGDKDRLAKVANLEATAAAEDESLPAAEEPAAPQEAKAEAEAAAPAPEPAAETERPKKKAPVAAKKAGDIDNFGEALPPARRAMAAKLDESLTDADIVNRPLSEIWPLAENEAIEDTFAAAVAHAARAEIPAKPRVAYKLRRWVETVKTVRGLAGQIVSGRVTREQMAEIIARDKPTLKDWWAKVRLLEQLPRDQWKRVGEVNERPDAFTYVDSKQVPMPSLRIEIDDKPHYLRGGGTVDSNLDEIRALLEPAAPEKRMEFEIRGRNIGPFHINKKGDGRYRPLMSFATVAEARAAITGEYDTLVAAWEAIKARDNITERDLRSAENRPRVGKDHRQGADVSPEKFLETFGFRGGEFGKWVQQGKGDKERQALLNSAYDALMDLSDILNIPPRAVSLNGTLGIAFGSRGSGWASAHFEPSNLVINLTKTRGAGALAHEWFHALDNYFSRLRGGEVAFTGNQKAYRDSNYITHKPEPMMVRRDSSRWPPMTAGKLEAMRKAHPTAVQYAADRWMPDPKHPQGVRPEVEERFAALVNALNESPMTKRAMLLDDRKSGEGYWSSTLERAARAFENHIQARMMDLGYHNDFLANVVGAEDTGRNPDRYPYLLPGEVKPIAEAFDALFGEIKTRTDDAGNVAMFSRSGRNTGMEAPRVRALAEAIASAWPNAPETIVAASINDPKVPKAVRDYDAAQRSQGATGSPEGFFFGGKVYLIADQLASAEDVLRVMAHETPGHYGLRGHFGPALDGVLKEIAAARPAEVRAIAVRYGLDPAKLEDRRIAAEELLAHMAQTQPTLGFVRRAIAAIKSWLRGLGFDIALTDDMIVRDFLMPARAFVQRGGARPASAQQFEDTQPAVRVLGPDGAPMFSRSLADTLRDGLNNVRDQRLPAGYTVSDFVSKHGRLSWWDKTVGTPYNLAKKHPKTFGRVYDAVQAFLGDVSHYATRAADLAPRILPKLDQLSDVWKSPLSAEDTKKISAPIFEGTLTWMRDSMGKPVKVADAEAEAEGMDVEDKARALLNAGRVSESVLRMWQGLPMEQYQQIIDGKFEREMMAGGIVWSDAELRSMWGLNDSQIALYREFRQATDRSLADLAVSDMVRYGGKQIDDATRQAALDAAEMRAGDKSPLQGVERAATIIRDALFGQQDPKLDEKGNEIVAKLDRVRDLMARGYAPLSRFGSHTLDVVDADGERVYFGLFETQREANRMARQMAEAYPDAKIEQGTLSAEAFKLFAGISPETAELFGEMLGLDAAGSGASNEAFQAYLRLSKANRSAMKRLLQRKGIRGFSEDAGRVLAGFVYSNARQTSSNLHMAEMSDAASAIPQQLGELKDAAIRLTEYVKNPQEEAQALRGLLFAQYLGGSIASAVVNMTQPIAVTFPWLSQHGGAAKAAARITQAFKDVAAGSTGDKEIDAALKRAEEDGIVSPQEVFQLMAQAQGRGSLRAGDGTMAGNLRAKAANATSKLMLGWGKLFGFAEQVNRRVTFIAAYRTAKANGVADPFKFAEDAVVETQFTYNKGNRPRWARGAVGATLFTFKTYSISYVELLHRMAKSGPEGRRAALLAIAMIVLLSGTDGLPFMEDAEDIADGLLQRLGYDFSLKRERNEFLASVLGKGGAEFVSKGMSGLPGAPIDVSGRLGMGDLVPGTGFALKKQDYGRDFEDVIGPAADFGKRVFQAGGQLIGGDPLKAIETVSPVAVRNVTKAIDMGATEMYRDDRGRKVIDTEPYEAVVKGIGFQPRAVAKAQNASAQVQRSVGLAKITEAEIADRIAQAMFKGDKEAAKRARDEVNTWNRRNPTTPIKISDAQIVKRLKNMRMSRAERLEKTAPREIRARVRAELAAEE